MFVVVRLSRDTAAVLARLLGAPARFCSRNYGPIELRAIVGNQQHRESHVMALTLYHHDKHLSTCTQVYLFSLSSVSSQSNFESATVCVLVHSKFGIATEWVRVQHHSALGIAVELLFLHNVGIRFSPYMNIYS